MRRLAALLILFLPFVAAGQSAPGASSRADRLLDRPLASAGAADIGEPLWTDAQGHLLSLQVSHRSPAEASQDSALQAFDPLQSGTLNASELRYLLAPNLQAHAEVSEYSSSHWPSRVIGSEVGATYRSGRYSVGVSVGTHSTPDHNADLPRVLPGGAPGVDGLSEFDSSEQLNARGRMSLGHRSGLVLGASVGRVHLLPGNLLGVETLDQKALSFGVDHGPISGTLIGRTISPQAATPGGQYADHRWNSIDLGVTWHLPWRGSLSVGAQNLWSSGTPANTPAGPEPDQSRTPYVQYHQDL